jgi:acyl-CoA dehydrogenase
VPAPATVPGQLEAKHLRVIRDSKRLATTTLERLEARSDSDLPGAAARAVHAMALAGILKHVVPKEFGGVSRTVEVRSIAAAREGIAYGSGLADAMLALQGLGSMALTLAGTNEQKKEWLPGVARGRAIAGFAVTEPEAGSDVASMKTTARRTKRGWEIRGAKTLISNAGIADFYTLFAKTDPSAGHKGISCFVVPGRALGLKVKPLVLMAPHPIGELALKGVKVPKESLVGAEGEGFYLIMRVLDVMRPTVAGAACGFAWRALDEAVRRAKERKQFGRIIGDNQGIRWKLAEAATDLEAARLLTYRAAWLKDSGQERVTIESAQAKLFATEAAQRIADLALQIHGGAGTIAGSVVERLYREVRALRIYEGTSEILRDVVARELLKQPGREKTSR